MAHTTPTKDNIGRKSEAGRGYNSSSATHVGEGILEDCLHNTAVENKGKYD